jgi:hypothetical protein
VESKREHEKHFVVFKTLLTCDKRHDSRAFLEEAVEFHHFGHRCFGPALRFQNAFNFLAQGLGILGIGGEVVEGMGESLAAGASESGWPSQIKRKKKLPV